MRQRLRVYHHGHTRHTCIYDVDAHTRHTCHTSTYTRLSELLRPSLTYLLTHHSPKGECIAAAQA